MPLIVSHRNEVYHMKQFQWEQLVSSKRIPPNQPKNDLSLNFPASNFFYAQRYDILGKKDTR